MTEASTTDPVSYAAEPAMRWLGAGFLVLGGAFFAVVAVTLAHVVYSAVRSPPPIVFVPLLLTFATACFFGGFGILSCIGTARGLPRLTVTPTGVRLATMFGVQWVEWSSLTAFSLSTVPMPRGGSLHAAKARIIGAGSARTCAARRSS